MSSTAAQARAKRPLNLSSAKIPRTNLSNADLTGASLVRANLSHADFTGAILRDADFREAILEGTILKGADLRGAKNLTRAQLAKAIIDDRTLLPESFS